MAWCSAMASRFTMVPSIRRARGKSSSSRLWWRIDCRARRSSSAAIEPWLPSWKSWRTRGVAATSWQTSRCCTASLTSGFPPTSSARQFHQWRRRAEKEQPQLLVVPRSRLMRHGASEFSEAQFPDRWQWRDLSLPLEYRFEPGHEEDGVTLVVPIALLNRIPAHRLDYLVPGLLRDKCIALARTLPRALRRQLVPD